MQLLRRGNKWQARVQKEETASNGSKKRTYVSGGDGEVVEEEEEGRGGDVQAEEGAAVAEAQPDRRVDRHHLGGDARPVRAALDVVRLEHLALQSSAPPGAIKQKR